MSRLQQRFEQNTDTEPTVVALSGGCDSVVLLYLYKEANVKIVAAHCNFCLRGDESDGDEAFCIKLCADWQIPLEIKRFDTAEEAQNRKISIQEMARELRYQFFEAVREKHDCAYIATAHHAADNAETILMNLVRGTGIRGLLGIPPQNGVIIRPILSFSKNEILEIAEAAELAWRNDSSNETDKYRRNYVRHHITPHLQHLNPNIENTLTEQSQHLRDVYAIFEEHIHVLRDRYCSFQKENDIFSLPINYISSFSFANTMLYEIIKEYGFNATQVTEMLRVTENGKQFFSKTHHAVISKSNLLIYADNWEKQQYFIDVNIQRVIVANAEFEIEHLSIGAVHIDRTDRSNLTTYLDSTDLSFPLVLRHWQLGDTIQPLGMDGHSKKVSEIFTNAKMSIADKERSWLLTDMHNETAWVVGLRMSEAFKINSDTKTVLKITCKPKPQQQTTH